MSSLTEESRERQRRALEINDNIVQGLATAKLQFELGDAEEGMASLEATLVAAKAIISDLLGTGVQPGDLRREQAAHIG